MVSKLEFIPPGKHNFMHHNRSGRKGGGTSLLFRDNIRAKKIYACERKPRLNCRNGAQV